MKPKFFLVHGTFVPNSSWTLAGEAKPLRLLLMQNFSLADEDLEAFRWSGANSLFSRQSGADELVKKINSVDRNRPVICIGHSHGGSVIHQAIARNNLDGRVNCVVTFNTPFFNYFKKDPNVLLNLFIFYLLLSAISVFLILTFIHLLPNLYSAYLSFELRDFIDISLFLMLLVVIGIVILKRNYVSGKAAFFGNIAKRKLDMLFANSIPENKVLNTTKFLCVNSYSDEVKNLFQALQVPINLTIFLEHLIFNFALMLFLTIYFIIYPDSEFAILNNPSSELINKLVYSFSNSTLIGIVFILLTPVIQLIMTILLLTFLGFRPFSDSIKYFFVRFEIAATPLNVSNVTSMDRPVSGYFLNHSALYSNREVVIEVCNWLKEKVKS